MTAKQNAALALQQHEAGLAYGSAIARLIIERFPGGFADEVSDAIIESTKESLTTVLDKLAQGGLAQPYREAYGAGYYIGLGNSLSTYHGILARNLGLSISDD